MKLCFRELCWIFSIPMFVFFSVWSVNSYAEDRVELKTDFQDTQPKYIANLDGTFSGLCVELLHLIEQKSKYRFKYPKGFVPNKRVYKNLKDGVTDVHCGLARNTEREQIYQFGESIYPVKHLVAIRADDPVSVNSFDDIRKLGNKGTILTPMGTATYDYLLKQGGLRIDDGGKTPEANLEKLANGRGRFFYYHDLGLLYEINRPLNQGKFRALPTAFLEYEHWMVFSKAVAPAIVEDISRTIRFVKNTKEYQEIINRYLKVE